MTGAFLRVKRNGKYDNVEVEFLTDEEREKILSKDDRLMNWLHLVCKTLSDADTFLNELVDNGTLCRVSKNVGG